VIDNLRAWTGIWCVILSAEAKVLQKHHNSNPGHAFER
jgi:hypothetical protein